MKKKNPVKTLVKSLFIVLLIFAISIPSAIPTDAATQTYTITYVIGSGTNKPKQQIKKHNKDIQITSQRPTRPGYAFYGWSKTPNATKASHSSMTTYKENKSLTLYAVWSKKSYRITYNGFGATSNNPNSTEKPHDVDVNISSKIPVRKGYVFKGWSTDKNPQKVNYKPNAKYTTNKNITLYAVWEKAK